MGRNGEELKLARIFKNYTATDVILQSDDGDVVVTASGSYDLSQSWKPHEIAASDQLVELLGMGTSLYQLNDGLNDLEVAPAIDLIRGYAQSFPLSNTGHIRVESHPTSGKSEIITSHNFADPTTWWGDSLRVTEEVLSNPSGDNTLYRSDHKHWIDLSHAKVTKEDEIIVDTTLWPNGPFTVIISVNDVVKVEDRDFRVDYRNGEVSFSWPNPENPKVLLGMGPLNPSDVVKATYSYENGSTWALRPEAGTKIRIVRTEVQFTHDIIIHDDCHWQTYVYNPFDLPNKVPYGTPSIYKSAQDYVNEGNSGTGVIKAFGGTGSTYSVRGLQHDVSVFPFDYLATKDVMSSVGAEVRVFLYSHTPYIGEYATATVYCLIENE